MRVIVVGCGRLGSELAIRLFDQGHEVSVIDSIPSAFNNLPSHFHGRIVEGEALSQDVLRRAGIEKADALVTATNNDALNVVVGHIAQSYFNIPRVASRNYDPHSRSMFESFNLQVVSSTSWGAQRLEELVYHGEIRTVFSAGNGEVEVYEVNVPERWHGKPMVNLIADSMALPVALSRSGRAVLPDANTPLQENDVILVSATLEGIEALRARLLSG